MDRFSRQSVSILAAISLCLAPLPALAASPAPVEAQHGMVVTAQHLATDVGVEVLKNGGNAVDAAVAVGYALAVVYPTAGNLGGGGFMTIRLKDGKTTFLDFRERAPLAATKTMYLDTKGDIVPRASLDGYLAIGTPGSVMGFETAREKYGTKTREELIAPALQYAKEGFTLEQGDAAGRWWCRPRESRRSVRARRSGSSSGRTSKAGSVCARSWTDGSPRASSRDGTSSRGLPRPRTRRRWPGRRRHSQGFPRSIWPRTAAT